MVTWKDAVMDAFCKSLEVLTGLAILGHTIKLESLRASYSLPVSDILTGPDYSLSAITSISKSSVVKASSLEKAPNFAPNISVFLNPNDFRSQVISLGT